MKDFPLTEEQILFYRENGIQLLKYEITRRFTILFDRFLYPGPLLFWIHFYNIGHIYARMRVGALQTHVQTPQTFETDNLSYTLE